ncbi:MerR family transcriptional regulator [Brenneria goodwinii]|uniref:Predicted transcriptional regulators n=1 Tax=Brenneria goodwinii TaxID=1109412 RepID=A0A0G4JVB2_9GAMM|nr:MerR family transcriptional regulator [Brenneria goodwinii]CPR16756.1 Predicted transcriptional regulators [Brenneria goodwinii]
MSDKYKIGAISKLLGIPVQTLRYYEECGFVTPRKDKTSNYRYYDAWDVNYLLDSKHLRSFKFSNTEIEQLINKDCVAHIQEKYAQQEKKLLDIIYHYQLVLDELNAEQKRLAAFQDYIGTFTEMNNPQLYFSPYRNNNSYQTLKGRNEITHIDNWISHMPFIKATFKIVQNSISKENPQALVYCWGFSVSIKKAKEMNISTQNAEYISSQKCIYTVFSAHNQNTFALSLYQQVFQPLWDAGYEISDAPVGRLIVRAHEDAEYTRYFEIWVPVRQTSQP